MSPTSNLANRPAKLNFHRPVVASSSVTRNKPDPLDLGWVLGDQRPGRCTLTDVVLDLILVAIGLVLAGAAAFDLVRSHPGRRITRVTHPWRAAGLYFVGLVLLAVGFSDLVRHQIGAWVRLGLVPYVAICVTPVSRHNQAIESAQPSR